jgi:hypothetical protein
MLSDKNIGSKNIRPLSTVAISLLIGCISSAAPTQTVADERDIRYNDLN